MAIQELDREFERAQPVGGQRQRPVAIASGTTTKCDANEGAWLSSPRAISQIAIEYNVCTPMLMTVAIVSTDQCR